MSISIRRTLPAKDKSMNEITDSLYTYKICKQSHTVYAFLKVVVQFVDNFS